MEFKKVDAMLWPYMRALKQFPPYPKIFPFHLANYGIGIKDIELPPEFTSLRVVSVFHVDIKLPLDTKFDSDNNALINKVRSVWPVWTITSQMLLERDYIFEVIKSGAVTIEEVAFLDDVYNTIDNFALEWNCRIEMIITHTMS